MDGASAPAVMFSFLIARWLGGVVGVTGRIEEHVGCALSPTSAGSVPAGNSLCLPCILLQMRMKAVCTAVVSWRASIAEVGFWEPRFSAAPQAASCLSAQHS